MPAVNRGAMPPATSPPSNQPLPAHPAFPIWWRPIEKTGPDKPWGSMAVFASLADAVRDNLKDGDTVAFEGFTHLIPFAAVHEAIRQERRDLWLVRMTPDLIYDQLIGM